MDIGGAVIVVLVAAVLFDIVLLDLMGALSMGIKVTTYVVYGLLIAVVLVVVELAEALFEITGLVFVIVIKLDFVLVALSVVLNSAI